MYKYFPQSKPSAFVDPTPFQIPVNSKGYTFGQVTMIEPTSSVGPSVPIMLAPAIATLSMFTTSPESYFPGGPLVPLGYKSLSRLFSGASSNPWTLPIVENAAR